MGRSGTTPHAGTRISIAVEIRPREAVRQCLQKRNDVILLPSREAKITAGHVEIVFWHRPAIYFFNRSLWTMSGRDRIRILVARIVEMHDLFQALEVAIVKAGLRSNCVLWLPGARFANCQ